MTHNDSTSRRKLLAASGTLIATVAGCSGTDNGGDGTRTTEQDTPQQFGTAAYSTTNYRTATRTRTQTETGPENIVAQTDEITLVSLNYAPSSREVRATIYNQTDTSFTYDLRFETRDGRGFSTYFVEIEGGGPFSPGERDDYTATIPQYLGEFPYYSVSYTTGYNEYQSLLTNPSDSPNPPVPAYTDPVSNPGQFASAEIASFTIEDSYLAEIITRVTNDSEETAYVVPTVRLSSSGGVSLDSDSGSIFPLQPGQTARCISSISPSGYEFSNVDSAAATIDTVQQMRLPPTTDVFDEVGRDTINGDLQVELRNTTNVNLGAVGIVRWLRGGDLIDLSLNATDDIAPGSTATLNLGTDQREGEAAYRATGPNVSYFTNDTYFGYYETDSGGNYLGFSAPFG